MSESAPTKPNETPADKPAETPAAPAPAPSITKIIVRKRPVLLGALFVGVVVATVIVTYVLVTIFEHRQDARMPWLRVQELNEVSVDPALWGRNWPHHYEQYKQTAGDRFYGGSSAMPESKLETSPWLKRLYAGYAFSIDYREARGHAYMLYDQVVTERVNKRPQAGACLHCHASVTVLYRKAGLDAMGLASDEKALAAEFNMPAVIRGFTELSRKPYHEVLSMLTQMPDGTPPGVAPETFPSAPVGGFNSQTAPHGDFAMSEAHPVSCIDCHDPETMKLRITRPGFMLGIQALAKSDASADIFPSIEAWRRGDRRTDYDPNLLASRHEMRSFVCGQCHVEYYCATADTLTFPWGKGLKAEDLEAVWEEHKFPDGTPFFDYKHAETGAIIYKVQHPEFELWAQGVHARSGVSCSDCHMPYERVGAMKLSNHNVRSPLENINNACQVCHNVSEYELRRRVETIQHRTHELLERAAQAMVDMLDAINEAKTVGATTEQLSNILVLQRRAMWRLDYISSENSRGFHAPQEAARILGESIDYSRQAQAAALRLRTPSTPEFQLPERPVGGVTPER